MDGSDTPNAGNTPGMADFDVNMTQQAADAELQVVSTAELVDLSGRGVRLGAQLFREKVARELERIGAENMAAGVRAMWLDETGIADPGPMDPGKYQELLTLGEQVMAMQERARTRESK